MFLEHDELHIDRRCNKALTPMKVNNVAQAAKAPLNHSAEDRRAEMSNKRAFTQAWAIVRLSGSRDLAFPAGWRNCHDDRGLPIRHLFTSPVGS
jgi:hypothetical protein